jgi:SIR2-like domain
MPNDFVLSLDAFVRSVGINKATPHALFLGAGSSITSGVPSAAMCIWEWKRSIFLTNNPGLEAQFSELSLPAVRLKIQRWLDSRGKYPSNGAPEEYGFYIQECFPIAEDRRAFFQEKTRVATPFLGYRVLVRLAEAGLVRSVWTPNFDSLTARAAAASNKIAAVEVGIDCAARLPRKTNSNELLCVSLHGDYRYDSLKNTTEELKMQDETLRRALIEEARHTPLIVAGYSGRDESLMNTLEDAYSESGTGSLYWCGFSDSEISPSVLHLIQKARAEGRSSHYIASDGFDDLLLRMGLHSLDQTQAEEVRQLLTSQQPPATDVRDAFRLPELSPCGIIKSNAFALTPPGEIYEFSLKKWPERGKAWEYFRASTQGKPLLVAAPFKNRGYAFGSIDDIRLAFGANIGETIERVPINDEDLKYEDGIINSLIRRALVSAFARRNDMNNDGRALIWKKTARMRRKHEGNDFLVYDAVVVYLRRSDGKNFAVLKPTVRIEKVDGGEAPREVERILKAAILGWQHNAEFNQAVEDWRKILMERERYEFPPDAGSPFKFQVQRSPVLAKLTSRDKRRQIQIQQKYANKMTQVAVELSEPKLIFSNREGNGQVSDSHPVRGIVRNRPFDYPLTSRHLASNIQLGVICPASESKKLSSYLTGLHTSTKAGQSEADYLPDFPGFQSAFGIPLQIPQPGDNLWVTCPEIDVGLNQQQGAIEFGQHITASLATLKAAASPSVTIVFIPTRWIHWRGFETESERFDLHNFVKAFCVPQGIATQFLEEDTLLSNLQCRIRWWLSLALYVKSMRTPWVLESLDADSAFVGLGMSLDRKAQKGNQVILGCSHLYNAQGQGLQFRLSKIENPVIRRRNAFMSFDDALRVGETIRQLFWESRFQLPNRVVIQKQTPFLEEERRGLQAGLSGVKEVDLLEIYIEDALRYLSSIPQKDGSYKEDKYPMRRGTIVKTATDTALLWVHGVSNVIDSRKNYYQGKRRIPAPLVIKRHAGRSDLCMIGEEILGLSKMNWNSFDLYDKLPATIETSRRIARIGSLLERFGSTSYDYRLFI